MTYPDSFYREIAELVRGERKGHGKLVADLYGVSVSTAHGWISRARQKGFLEKPQELPCRLCGGTGKAPARDPVAARAARWPNARPQRAELRAERGDATHFGGAA